MAANTQLKPFPYELFKDLQITEDNLVIQNGELIGELDFPSIINVQDLDSLDNTRVEELLKQGIVVYGYRNHNINDKGIPVAKCNIDGYPNDSLTIDVFELVYYKNICVGKWGYPGLKEISPKNMERLDELGTEYSFQWQMVKPKPKPVEMIYPSLEIIVVPYDKSRGLYRETNYSGIVKLDLESNVILTGMLKNGVVVPPTEDEKQSYIEMGIKVD